MLHKKVIDNLQPGDAFETRDGRKLYYGGLSPVTDKPYFFDEEGEVLTEYCLNLKNFIRSSLDIISVYRTDTMREFEKFAEGKKVTCGNMSIKSYVYFDYWINEHSFRATNGHDYCISKWRQYWEEYKESSTQRRLNSMEESKAPSEVVNKEYVEYTDETFDRNLWFRQKSDIMEVEEVEFPVQAYVPNKGKIMVRGIWCTFKHLLEQYTHTDGTPAGVKK